MSPQLQTILDSIQNMADLSESEKESLVKKIKETDKAQSLSQFKLDRLEKDRNTLTIMLQESIEDLQKKSRAIEAQNRELEIESSLEKVRRVAMGMRKRDDMLDICRIMSGQLELLGIKEIRNVQTAIFYKHRGTYINYEYYRLHDKALVTEVDYTNDEISVEFAAQMIKGADEVYVRSLEDQQVKDWLNFQKTTNVFIDTNLENARSLTYYWFSLGPVAIGTSTYNPLSEEEIALFKRFRNVFDLAYRRYLDIEKAEAQARESQIQLALERVRARTMAMHKSDELAEVAILLFQQVSDLGIKTWTTGFNIWSDDNNSYEDWITNPQGGFMPPYTIDASKLPVSLVVSNAKKRGDEFLVNYEEGESLAETYRQLSKFGEEQFTSILESGFEFPSHQYEHFVFGSKVSLMFITYDAVPEAHDIFKRFGKVFEQTYTRFLDLQTAEAQARESQIQLALERVRARTMAMQKSDELNELIKILFSELRHLEISLDRCLIMTYDPQTLDSTWWMASRDDISYKTGLLVPYHTNAPQLAYIKGWQERKEKWTYLLEGDEKKEWDEFLFGYTALAKLPDEVIAGMKNLEKNFSSASFKSFGCLTTGSFEPLTDEAFDILIRFTQVFDQAYTRFLDLQTAEAQAREAQIEAALERVRSQSMAMRTSEELKNVVRELRKQMGLLGQQELDTCVIQLYDESPDYIHSLASMKPTESNEEILDFDRPIPKKGLLIHEEALQAYSSGRKDYILLNEKRKLEQWIGFIKKTYPDIYTVFTSTYGAKPEEVPSYWSFSDFNGGSLLMVTLTPPSDVSTALLRRFANVFGQAYRRYVDIRQAEAQAKESQIQLALERVRARTMAMQHSDELKDAAALLFQQVKSLGVPAYSCGYNIWEKDEKEFTSWMSTQDGSIINGVPNIPLTEDANFIRYVESKRNGEPFFVLELRGERMQEHYQYLKTIPAFKVYFDYAVSVGFDLPKTQIHHLANFSQGNLLFITLEPCPEFHDVFKRFAAVFEQTYTRFLDLQKAEAQARESQIQLALERVRARTMAMQKSDELAEAARVLYEEFRTLNISTFLCGYCFYKEEQDKQTIWVTFPDGTIIPDFIDFPITGDHILNKRYEDWKQKKPLHVLEIQGEENKEHHRFLASKVSDQAANEIFAQIPDRIIVYGANFSTGYLFIIATELLTGEEEDVIIRFAKVFELTYTRFNDLKQAEAQARESQIQLALERVRARTMAMQKSDELTEASNLLLQQVQSLGIPVWACGYDIWEIGEKVCTAWMSVLGAIQPSFRLPLTEHRTFIHMYESRLKAEPFYVEEVSGEELADHYRYMFSLPDFKEIATKQLQGSSFPLPQSQTHHVFNFKHGNLIFLSAEAIPGALDIFKRFTAVFEQTYTRFLDLQKAEAQTRESQIELGLERVRARAMAMQKSDELSELVDTVFKELTKLDFALTWCIINIIDEPSMSNMVWAANPDIDKAPDSYHMKFEDYPFHHMMMKGWKERKAKYVYVLEGTEKKIYDKYLFNETEFRKVPEAAQAASSAMEKYVVSFSFSNFGGLQTVGDAPLSDANLDILSRFGNVFDLTYTRFNDLKQAEAQAREGQIEAALERVRSRSMGMQKSEELKEVIQVVYEQFVHLNIYIEHTGFIMDYKARDDMNIWLADKHEVPFQVTIPYFDCAHWNSFNEAKEKGKDFFANKLSFEEKNKFYRDLFKLIPGVPDETKEYYFSCPGLAISTVLLENVCLYIENFSGIPYSDEENNTLMRFGKVFQQTYTRFLDLQKAEEQAREAKIEAALENVRSRSLAMHHSNELKEVVKRVFEKMKELGFFQNNSVMIVLPKNGFKDVLHWTFNEHFETMEYNIPAFNHSVSTDTYKAWKRGEKTFEIKLNKEEKDDFLYQIFKYTDYSKVPDEFKKHLYSTEAYNSFIVFENHCGLLVDTFTSVNYSEDQKDVVKRFAKVFEQAYIRFLDLQKAEAQAREAKIETALEKVRSRTMAMQHSDELANVATVLFQQVKALGVPQWTCGFSIFEIDDKEFTWYPGSVDGDILSPSKIPLTEHPVFIQFNESRKRGDELFVYEKKGEVQADHYRYMCSLPGTGEFLQKMLDAGLTFPDFQIDHLANFSHGNLIFITYEPFPEMHDVFKRFAKVFEQTYTRFLDLKKAEAQALEAIKRASVDRIRAEIASMRTTNDLERITPLIWNELTTLGVPFVRCGVFIMDEEKQLVETHLSTPDGKAIASFTSTFSGTQLLTEILPYWQRKEVYKIHWDEAMFLEQAKSLVAQGSITSGEKYLTENRPTDLYLHFLPFLQGMLYAGNTAPLSDDELQLMQNLGDAFSTAYARYEDFNKLEVAKQQIEKTLVDLKQAQQQLVQSEKMASLGELTAGIAHEIQNPLNFVNNFSDVNTELVDELKSELAIGNMQLANEIADNIKDNEQKINHHGKRADAIVKNMLQHSRSSGAAKELTDINKLADEYLRLSYHGLRAKDKSFNADFKTELDSNVGKINVISQDIGRVLLNLINNAFYATNEKKKTAGENYKPLVSVLTKKINNNIEIAVTDNGKGIPPKIADKIFQPFFTTKPTGSGTGLGLSLSYDIIKAHGGEIKVESKEGEGSVFIIRLTV